MGAGTAPERIAKASLLAPVQQAVAAARKLVRDQARDQIDGCHGFGLGLMQAGFQYGRDAAEPELPQARWSSGMFIHWAPWFFPGSDRGFDKLPTLILRAGEKAAWPFIEFFTAGIRNKNTRAAYAEAVTQFFHWCDLRHIRTLDEIRPFIIGTYIEGLQTSMSL